MAFATNRALVYGAAVAIGLVIGLVLLKPEIGFQYVALQAGLTGVLAGLVFGWIMRGVTAELPGQSAEQIEAALAGSIQTRGFRRVDGEGGIVRFERGAPLGDVLTVVPTATGVMLDGPAHLVRLVRRRAAI